MPVQFGTRILMGAVCGAALTAGAGSMLLGAIVGIAGAVAGTLGGQRVSGAHGRGLRRRSPRRPAGGRDRHRGRFRRRSGVAMNRFDAIVIGTGQAGPPLAGRLTARRHDRCRHRAQARRGHLRQHRLHAHQDSRGERPGRLHRPPRRRLRRPRRGRHPGGHAEGEGARRHRRGELSRRSRPLAPGHEGLHAHRGPCTLRSAGPRARGGRSPDRSPHLHQRGRPPVGASPAGGQRRALPDQSHDPGARPGAGAPAGRRAAATSASSSPRCTGASGRRSRSSSGCLT